MRRLIVILVLLSLFLSLGAAALAQSGGFIQHYVRPGENLFRISLRYGVSIQAIMAANPIIRNPNLIYAGTTLVIPTGGTVPTAAPVTPIPVTPGTPPPTQQPGAIIHVVQRGDTLSRLAAQYRTTVQAIASTNGIVNPNLIFVGQRLTIYPGGGVGPVPTTPPPGATTPPPGPTTPPPPPPPGGFELGGQVFGFGNSQQMRQAGMTWAKVQLRYNLGDPASIAQGAINEARSNGFKILLSVIGSPEQLRANPGQYFTQFAQFLGGVAQLGPDAIEVWNEQNIDREWPAGLINPASYTQMLSAAYQAIKAANASVLVISGAPAPTGFFGGACTPNGCDDDAFIRGMAANGAANVMDCVGIHYNEGILSPDATSGDPRGNSGHYTRYYPAMVNLYSSVFPSKPLCFTELGYLSPEGFGPLPPGFTWAANTTVQDQATWLARAAVLSRDGGRVRLMIVWNVNATQWTPDPQAGFAIIRPNNTCLACNTLGGVMGGGGGAAQGAEAMPAEEATPPAAQGAEPDVVETPLPPMGEGGDTTETQGLGGDVLPGETPPPADAGASGGG